MYHCSRPQQYQRYNKWCSDCWWLAVVYHYQLTELWRNHNISYKSWRNITNLETICHIILPSVNTRNVATVSISRAILPPNVATIQWLHSKTISLSEYSQHGLGLIYKNVRTTTEAIFISNDMTNDIMSHSYNVIKRDREDTQLSILIISQSFFSLKHGQIELHINTVYLFH